MAQGPAIILHVHPKHERHARHLLCDSVHATALCNGAWKFGVSNTPTPPLHDATTATAAATTTTTWSLGSTFSSSQYGTKPSFRLTFQGVPNAEGKEAEGGGIGVSVQGDASLRCTEGAHDEGDMFDFVAPDLYHQFLIMAMWADEGMDADLPLLQAGLVDHVLHRLQHETSGLTSNAVPYTDMPTVKSLRAKALMPFTLRPSRRRLCLPRGVLLHGPPGSGKTRLATSVLPRCGFMVVLDGSASSLAKKYVGETEEYIRKQFATAANLRMLPTCIILDEVDSVASVRRATGPDHSNSWMNELLSQLSKDTTPALLFVGMTNRKAALDPAFVRRGRVGLHIYVGRLAPEDRWRLLHRALETVNLINPGDTLDDDRPPRDPEPDTEPGTFCHRTYMHPN